MADDTVIGIPLDNSFPYSSITINRSQVIGSGSYGYVCSAKCDALPCAAKALHKILFQCGDTNEVDKLLSNFIQECQLLSSLLHPNIVQFIGVCTIHGEEGTPVLLTELMDESLWNYIRRKKPSSPLSTQLGLMYDVAKALDYLHNRNIIHRDLSSNNILLLKGSTAKVTDFGMAKLRDASKKHFTQCPGTAVFMAPEALHDTPQYSNKLDVFSWAVVSIHLMSRHDPDPTPFMKSQINLDGQEVFIRVPERERRAKEIASIDSSHPLLPLALFSLGVAYSRPTAHELCNKMEILVSEQKEKDRIEMKEEKMKEEERRKEEERKKEAKRKKEEGQKEKGKRVVEIEENKEMENKGEENSKIQSTQTNLQDHSTINNTHNSTNTTNSHHTEIKTPLHVPSLSLHGDDPFSWSTLKKPHETPCIFPAGSSITTLAGKVFLSRPHSTIIHVYDPISLQWSTLPINCPVENFTLIAHIGKILAVGGINPVTKKGSKVVYSYDILNRKPHPSWNSDLIKDMYYKRSYPIVASLGTNLIVAGGIDPSSKTPLSSVEIHTGSQWYSGYNLTMPVSQGIALITEDSTVYVIGGTVTKGSFIQSISLETLLYWKSSLFWQPFAFRETWRTTPLPVSFPGAVMIARQLILLGGVEDQGSSSPFYSNNVYTMATSESGGGNKFNISIMPRARGCCLATVLPSNENLVMVMGGCGSKSIDIGKFKL